MDNRTKRLEREVMEFIRGCGDQKLTDGMQRVLTDFLDVERQKSRERFARLVEKRVREEEQKARSK